MYASGSCWGAENSLIKLTSMIKQFMYSKHFYLKEHPFVRFEWQLSHIEQCSELACPTTWDSEAHFRSTISPVACYGECCKTQSRVLTNHSQICSVWLSLSGWGKFRGFWDIGAINVSSSWKVNKMWLILSPGLSSSFLGLSWKINSVSIKKYAQ